MVADRLLPGVPEALDLPGVPVALDLPGVPADLEGRELAGFEPVVGAGALALRTEPVLGGFMALTLFSFVSDSDATDARLCCKMENTRYLFIYGRLIL